MTRTIIAAFVALGIAGAIAAPASAHKFGQQSSTEKPFQPKDFWDQQQHNSGG
jgi:hypothetical protein